MKELTALQRINYKNAKYCHICERKLEENSTYTESEELDIDGKKKVRDHDHLTGEFRGAAHSICNLITKFQDLYQYSSTIFLNDFDRLTFDRKVTGVLECNRTLTTDQF